METVTRKGYDCTLPIRECKIGDRVACYFDRAVWNYEDEVWHGTVMWIGTGSVEVWWDHEKQTCRVQPELDVWLLEVEELSWDQIEQLYWQNPITNQESGNMAEVALSPAQKALVARFNFQTNELIKALEGDDKAKASIIRGRIEKVAGEAAQTGVELPPLPKQLEADPEVVELVSIARSKVEEKQKKAEEVQNAHLAREVAKEKHKNEVGANKAGKEPKLKKEKVMRPCLDGCGTMVPGNFAMGHDAKLKSLLLKIERGDLGLDSIPEPCLDLVKIVKGEPVEVRDSKGELKETKETYRIVAAPVKFPGREDIQFTKRDD